MTQKLKAKRTCSMQLKTIQHVQIELARVYRKTKRGARQNEDGGFDTADGMRLCQILHTLRQALESSEFERRLSEMEAAVNKPVDTTPLFSKFAPKVVK